MKKITFNPPVQTLTTGQYPATIFEIDPDDVGDGVGGRVVTPGMGDIVVAWNDVGICRGTVDSSNLDPRKPEVAAVIEQLKQARNQ